MKVEYIKIFDWNDNVISERTVSPEEHLFIPNVGTMIRLDSGKYDGFYKVYKVVWDERDYTIEIYINKI